MIRIRRQPPASLERVCIALSLVFIAGAGIESRQFRPPPDAHGYQDRVYAVANQLLPKTMADGDKVGTEKIVFGDWVGTENNDVDTSKAVQILHPIVMKSWEFKNDKLGESAGLLCVDCGDARDTVGHYPPICYPSQGWSLQLSTSKVWQLSHMTVYGMEYKFVRSVYDGSGQLIVDDFFVLPGAGTTPDRTAVMKAAGDLQRRFYGVAQLQVVFSSEYTSEARDRAFVEIIEPIESLLQTVQAIKPDERSGRDEVPSDGVNVPQ